VQFTREEMAEKLLVAYGGNYNVIRLEEPALDGLHFASADFQSTLSRYVLSKEVKLWEAENNEFVYLFSVDTLDVKRLEAIRDYVLELGLPRVKPHDNHMYTYITAVILADQIPPETQKAIRKMEYLKNYKFSLHGFSALRMAAWESASAQSFTNAHGREVGDFINGLSEEKKAKKKLFG